MKVIFVFLCVAVIASAHHPSHHQNRSSHSHAPLPLSHHNGNNSLNLCDFEPTRNHQLCDKYYPSSCFPPLCAVGTKGEHKWFKNKCYLEQYNGECLSKFTRVDDSKCDAKTKPSVDPNPCPITDNNIEACVAGTIVHEVKKHCDCHV